MNIFPRNSLKRSITSVSQNYPCHFHPNIPNGSSVNMMRSVKHSKKMVNLVHVMYGKCSKIPNTSCLPNRHRQTALTQIRLLLKKQSDQGLHCFMGENSFQQNPLNISNIVAVNADFKEITLEAKSRKTLKSADPLKILTTALCNFDKHFVNSSPEK